MARPHVIGIRFSDDEHLKLSAEARAAGCSLSVWCRNRIVEQLGRRAWVEPPAAAQSDESLSRVVGAKVTASQYFDLEVRARGAGVPIGTYLRLLIQGQPPTPRWPLARAAIVALNRAGNNLNQLVKLAHQGMPMPSELYRAVESVRAEVRAVRTALVEEARE